MKNAKKWGVSPGKNFLLPYKFIVNTGKLISSGSKPFIVEAGELVNYNFQSALWEFWVEGMIPSLM